MQVYSIVQLPSSLGPTCRPWTLRITIGSYVLSMCPMHRHWALCVVDMCYVSSWDPMRHCTLSLCPTYLRWILRIVVGPYVSSLDPMFRHWILCFVVGSYVLSSGPTCCRRVLHIVVGGPKRRLVGESVGDRLYCPRILLAAVDFDSPLLGSTRR